MIKNLIRLYPRGAFLSLFSIFLSFFLVLLLPVFCDYFSIMKTISLKEVLTEINKKDSNKNPVPFSCAVYTLNRNSKKGGQLIQYENAKLLVGTKKTNLSEKAMTVVASTLPKEKRNPNHFKNATRNIELSNGEIKKIHIRFIDTFNGKKMVY